MRMPAIVERNHIITDLDRVRRERDNALDSGNLGLYDQKVGELDGLLEQLWAVRR